MSPAELRDEWPGDYEGLRLWLRACWAYLDPSRLQIGRYDLPQGRYGARHAGALRIHAAGLRTATAAGGSASPVPVTALAGN